jgi:membrane protein
VLGVGTVAEVYLPRAVAESVARFGPYGVVFTALSWLIVLFTALTVAVTLGRVIAQEPEVARRLGSVEPAPAPTPTSAPGGPATAPGPATATGPVVAAEPAEPPGDGREPEERPGTEDRPGT